MSRINGGCKECGGICGGAKNPNELLDQVLQMVEEGYLTGGDVAYAIQEYRGMGMRGEGFWGDFVSGLKKGFTSVIKPALSIGSIFVPQLRPIAGVVNALGGRKKKTRRLRKRSCTM